MISPAEVNFETSWQHPDSYRWTLSLPRIGWAWEFLRRNKDYRAAWTASAIETLAMPDVSGVTILTTSPESDSIDWGLAPPWENPDRDSRSANVFWSENACPSVLPIVALDDGPGLPLILSQAEYLCRTIVHVAPNGVQRVLFTRDGKFLQLEVRGASIFSATRVLADVVAAPAITPQRLKAIEQLADLVEHRDLREVLHTPDGQGRRLSHVLQALDGWLAGVSHRLIATALFGEERVARDWRRVHLRDSVRRAIYRGRALSAGGYLDFVR